jgi:2-oxo-4-hydroxy-4-carboxy-5-ureidoimidazoline decarboxylase
MTRRTTNNWRSYVRTPNSRARPRSTGTLTQASAAEQASAGPRPPDAGRVSNASTRSIAAYRARFDFPFIICVRLTDKAGILAAMERRLGNDRDTEIATALEQIGEIVRLRLELAP